MDEEIVQRISDFKSILSESTPLEVVQTCVYSGSAYALSDSALLSLRRKTAAHFEIHLTDVYLVGSAKLGFSIKPTATFRPFSEDSDLDLAVVSSAVFDQVWLSVARYIESNPFWGDIEEFARYLRQGWIRPDKLPISTYFPFRDDWWRFFGHLRKTEEFGPYPIRAGLYKSAAFLEMYQCRAVKACKDVLG